MKSSLLQRFQLDIPAAHERHFLAGGIATDSMNKEAYNEYPHIA
jgi:hypothetical protein